MLKFFKPKVWIIAAGLAVGILSAFLVSWGDPIGTGISPTCFIRDTAGAIGLHQHLGYQAIRPEIIGLVLGSFIAAYSFREFRARGGSSTMVRFFLGALIMVGALTFLGCPVRATLRLAAGDLNGLTGLAGVAAGTFVGVLFMKRGFNLSRATNYVSPYAGWIVPAGMVGLLLLAIFKPSFILSSPAGSWGWEQAALPLSLGAGLIVGFLAQRSRMCFMGAWRDIYLVRSGYLMTGLVTAFIGAVVFNIILGQFKLGFWSTPEAVIDNHLWNFLSMALVGLAAALLGACPMRQLILSGEGDTDAGATVLGLFAGAALSRNFNLSSCGGDLAEWAPLAVSVGLVFCLAVGFFMREK